MAKRNLVTYGELIGDLERLLGESRSIELYDSSVEDHPVVSVRKDEDGKIFIRADKFKSQELMILHVPQRLSEDYFIIESRSYSSVEYSSMLHVKCALNVVDPEVITYSAVNHLSSGVLSVLLDIYPSTKFEEEHGLVVTRLD